MNLDKHRRLQAEQATLDNLLSQLPSESVIERMSLESRKKVVDEALSHSTESLPDPVRVRLTFRGKPVIGSHGVFAEFGTTAVNSFTEAVAAIGASRFRPLGARGAIPNKDDFRLLITGTAIGSFGFEFEEPPTKEMTLFNDSPVELAIEQTRAIMEASLESDEALTEAISEADPRAIEGLRGFFKIMAEREAVCTLEINDSVFQFTDVEQVRRSEQRLSQDNIHEEESEITGKFLGILPIRRTFEFTPETSDDPISGKVDPSIEDTGQINQVIGKTVKIRVNKRHVGTGNPRYILLSYEEL